MYNLLLTNMQCSCVREDVSHPHELCACVKLTAYKYSLFEVVRNCLELLSI